MELNIIPSSLICLHNPKSVVAEAFRTLRTNIQFAGVNKDLSSLMVTSCGPGEGKSVVVSNLAASLAQAGKKVLLIDGDVRKPTVHKQYKLTNIHGLTTVLVGEDTFNEAVRMVPEIGLEVLTSGPTPPNPAEMIGSRRMIELLEQVKHNYDMVLIDTPPVLAVTDAQLLSSCVDGVLMVVSVGAVPKENAQKAKALLEHVGANIIGTVLNKKVMDKSGSYYYYA